ncbi:MAG TPA: hypothetical protein VES67_10380 [Vicinamibacterales bacterium]|nr:hypothetical protein [Vicinamibacterales bacterium]
MSPEPPRIDRRDLQLGALLVVGGLLVQLPALLWGFPGGKAINNALRILDGDVPYRDFWTMYAPGHFYLVAAVFKLFGTHVWVQGVVAQLFLAADAALLFIITRRLGLERRLAMLVGVAFVGMHWGHSEVSSYETVLLFVLLALDRAICYAHGRGARALIVAGALCGIGASFKHDVSFYFAFGIVAGLSAGWLFLSGRRPEGWVSPAGMLVRFGGGAVAAALPMAAFLAWKAGPDAWNNLIVFPATDFSVVRGEGYPSLLLNWASVKRWATGPFNLELISEVSRVLSRWVQANVPQIAFLAGVIGLARRRRTLAPGVVAVAAISLAAMPLFWAAAHVQHNTNFSSLWIFSVLLATLVWVGGRMRPLVRMGLAVLFVVATGSFLVRPARQIVLVAAAWTDHATLDFPSVAGIRLPAQDYRTLAPIVSFIRQHVPEDEPIYAGLVRHDAVVISEQSFYYLAGRRVASRYNELHPGVVDREDVQREIIADLDRLNVRCAVLWEFGWPRSVMEDMLAHHRRYIPGIGSTLLDEYLRREFRHVARYGEYVLVWRKNVAGP